MNKQDVIRRNGPQAMELFMAAFQSFRKAAPNGRQVEIRIRNSPETLEQAWRLKQLAQWVDAYMSLGGRQVAAPAKFAKVWRDFNDEYREVIDVSTAFAIKPIPEGREVVKGPHSLFDIDMENLDDTDWYNPGEDWVDFWTWMTSGKGGTTPPHFDEKTEFWPGHDDPVQLVETAVDYFSQQDWKAEEQDFFNNSKKVWDAWDYLKDTLGLDTDGLWGRWTAVPLVLSQHVGHPTISELFDEAVRCFAFGQFAAAMAMCRALLEEVLDRLYGVHGDGLHANIIEAQQRYGELRGVRLIQLKDIADDVLHNHSRWRKRRTEAQRLVLQFLETLKAVIEEADVKKKP